jgi:outer membrane protein assembly factor BamA
MFADPYAPMPIEPFRGFVSSVRLGYRFSNADQFLYSVGAERGLTLSMTVERADRALGSDLEGTTAAARAFFYVPLPWSSHHVLALGSTVGASDGPAAPGFALGGYQSSPLLDSILNGAVQSRLTLRGYPSAQFQGSHLLLGQAEYRFPLYWVDRGISTLPLFLRGFAGALGADYGGAFTAWNNRNLWRSFRLGLAGEFWSYLTLGYGLDLQLALGYARGTGQGAIPQGTFYLVVSSAI